MLAKAGPALFLSLLLALPALAEPAIGRLNHAGYRHKQHCTAVLVAPDMALTATHCLQGLDPREAHLLLGYDRGSWQEHLRPNDKHDLGSDLSLLCLTQAAKAPPLALAAQPPHVGETLIASGYGIPSMHLKREKSCKVTILGGKRTFQMDCLLSPGNSGGPILRRGAEGDEIVGIASASNDKGSLAVSTDLALNPDFCRR